MPDAFKYTCGTAAAVAVAFIIDLIRTFRHIKAPDASPGPEKLGLPAAFSKLANARDVAAGPGMVTNDRRRLRQGLLYRSATLHGLPLQDLQLLQHLGIRFVADFRSQEEAASKPDSFAPGHAVHHSLFEAIDEDPHKMIRRILWAGTIAKADLSETRAWVVLRDITWSFVSRHGPKFRAFLEKIAEEGNLPVLVHSTAGKDRTGWAIAVLLLVLGIDKEAVIKDYLLSNKLWYAKARRMMCFFRLASGLRVSPEACEPLLLVRREYLEMTMKAATAAHGSWEAYVTAPDGLNLAPATVRRLRDLFLEQEPASKL